MAKLLEGILGGFSGKVGQVVGIQWKGRSCMRSYVARISDRRSPLQLEQRSRFTAMIRMAQQSMYAIRLGFKQKADEHKVTEGNWFSHRNTDAFRVVEGAVVVDYERLKFSEGHLAGVAFAEPVFDSDCGLRIDFEDDRNLPGTSRLDSVYVYAYVPTLGEGLLLPAAERKSEVFVASFPVYWRGNEVHLYGFTVGKKGGVSNSAYLGSGTAGDATRRLEQLPQSAAAAPLQQTPHSQGSYQLSLFMEEGEIDNTAPSGIHPENTKMGPPYDLRQ